MRIGIGYDLHRLVKGRKLTLGGVEIPHERGLFGHSDADVLLHAIADAVLGAAGLPDIGNLFPDDEPKYKGIASTEIIDNVLKIVRSKGFSLSQMDAIIIAEQPKLAPYMDKIISSLSNVLAIPRSAIGLKAKTNEGLGYIGSGEAIAAYAVVLLAESKG